MNITKFSRILPLAVVLTALSACSSSPDDEEIVIANKGAEALYEDAKNSMKVGNFSQAAATLSALDSRYPFGPLSHQVQLDLIYSYYKAGKTEEALATIDRFIRLNPNHSDVDYAVYMRGLVNMGSDSNYFQDIVGIDRSDRDAKQAHQAFKDFKELLQKYPNSKYAADARQRMKHIKNRLAKYELAVARYYMKRGAYVSAANRGQYVVEHFSDTEHVQGALEIMVTCYEQLGLPELKDNAMQTLRLNFPNSEYL